MIMTDYWMVFELLDCCFKKSLTGNGWIVAKRISYKKVQWLRLLTLYTTAIVLLTNNQEHTVRREKGRKKENCFETSLNGWLHRRALFRNKSNYIFDSIYEWLKSVTFVSRSLTFKWHSNQIFDRWDWSCNQKWATFTCVVSRWIKPMPYDKQKHLKLRIKANERQQWCEKKERIIWNKGSNKFSTHFHCSIALYNSLSGCLPACLLACLLPSVAVIVHVYFYEQTNEIVTST